jgi:hypothetical protein
MAIKGKLCHFSRKDIKRFDKGYIFDEHNVLELYDILEEQMLNMGFVMYDEDIDFLEEVIVNRWHYIRYSCMVLKGKRIKGRFILSECLIQYMYIK